MKRIEDFMDVAEAAGAPCTDAQFTNKEFSTIIKDDLFHDGMREWKRKPTHDKTWATFKQHFATEMK